MMEFQQGTKGSFAETGLKLDKQHDDERPFSTEHQIQTIIRNIKIYLSFLIEESVSSGQIQQIKTKLIQQLQFVNSDELHIIQIQDFTQTYANLKGKTQVQGYKGFDNLNSFAQVLNSLVVMRQDTQNEETYHKTGSIINGFLKEMQIILKEDNFTINRIQNYEVYSNNIDKSCDSNDREIQQRRQTHFYPKQKISFDLDLAPEVFEWVQPPLHRTYISEVTKVYHEVVPFKIKHIIPGNTQEGPKIQTPNYFKQQIDPEKAVMYYCKPNTKLLYTYRLDDICKLLTIEKQYLFERQLPIEWTFSPFVKTVITPEGRIFSINSKTNSKKIDSSMYQILEQKVSNKGRRPDPKRNSSFIYANNALYVIGGNNDNQPCSQKNYKYSLKDKKWSQIADSNIALRKPTICTFRERYILKFGGLNEFNYISKNIELYDTKTNRWSIVRAAPRNIMEQVQILQDSLAIQISEDQVYIFSGKNSNNFQSDSGFVLQLNEIIERQKGPAKVSGEFWNVSVGKRSLYSFFGLFSQSNVITHYNCLYALRVDNSKSLPF